MAKESSFDIVSEVDLQELDNAYQQAARELTQRYDLKESGARLDFSKKDLKLTIEAPSEFIASQVRDVICAKLTRRNIDAQVLSWGSIENASGMSVRQHGTVVQGIAQDLAKKIAKDIRDLKLKCKATVEGDKLRVSSPSRDVLQEVIAACKQKDYGQPLQYTNYR